jgi:hypothetical protein
VKKLAAGDTVFRVRKIILGWLLDTTEKPAAPTPIRTIARAACRRDPQASGRQRYAQNTG